MRKSHHKQIFAWNLQHALFEDEIFWGCCAVRTSWMLWQPVAIYCVYKHVLAYFMFWWLSYEYISQTVQCMKVEPSGSGRIIRACRYIRSFARRHWGSKSATKLISGTWFYPSASGNYWCFLSCMCISLGRLCLWWAIPPSIRSFGCSLLCREERDVHRAAGVDSVAKYPLGSRPTHSLLFPHESPFLLDHITSPFVQSVSVKLLDNF